MPRTLDYPHILDYTTQVSAHKTVGEIQGILAKAGATSISIDYNASGDPEAIRFLIFLNKNPVEFRLPTRVDGVLDSLLQDPGIPRKYKSREQALRVAWRIIKDWIEAQMAIIQAGLASLPEVFLPYSLTKTGETLFHLIEREGGLHLMEKNP